MKKLKMYESNMLYAIGYETSNGDFDKICSYYKKYTSKEDINKIFNSLNKENNSIYVREENDKIYYKRNLEDNYKILNLPCTRCKNLSNEVFCQKYVDYCYNIDEKIETCPYFYRSM